MKLYDPKKRRDNHIVTILWPFTLTPELSQYPLSTVLYEFFQGYNVQVLNKRMIGERHFPQLLFQLQGVQGSVNSLMSQLNFHAYFHNRGTEGIKLPGHFLTRQIALEESL